MSIKYSFLLLLLLHILYLYIFILFDNDDIIVDNDLALSALCSIATYLTP